MQVTYRTLQFVRQLRNKTEPEADAALRQLVSPAQWDLIARLSPADRAHLLRVHRALLADNWQDRDLLTAAVLHDIGKADETMRVRLVHRVLKVLLGPYASRFARANVNVLQHGLYLSLNHQTLGASMARQTGANDRACWLIEHHHDGTIHSDAELTALRIVDERE
jgi:putative nucleotidyltransferase with HDIG domain